MSDNTQVSAGTGDFVRDIDRGGVKTQVVQLDVGGSSAESLVSTANPLPVREIDGDNTSLFSGSISAAGPGAWIDTTGWDLLTLQFSGSAQFIIYLEASNDQSAIDSIFSLSRDEVSMQDVIDQNGLYTVRPVGKWLRYNVARIVGSATTTILGRTHGGIHGADLLSFAMDATQNLPLYTSVVNQPVRDSQGRLMTSDAPDPIQMVGIAGNIFTIDTQGYQSFNITSFAQTANITCCNDREGTFVALSGTNAIIAAAYLTATTANNSFSFPCIARFIRVTVVTAGVSLGYLRAAPWVAGYATPLPNNMAQIAGTASVTSPGVSGMLAVGGNIAAGSAPTAAPVLMAGVDTSATPLTRRILTDPSGRLIPALLGGDGVYRPNGGIASSFQNAASLAVQDTSQHEGASVVQLLAQILTELRINNEYLFDQNRGITSQDEPGRFRNDPTIFNL